MRERAFTFGSEGSLTGVLCEPTEGDGHTAVGSQRPTLLVANVGLNPRIGPYRLWVKLSRAAAAVGVRTLRFDLSGLGDSARRNDRRGDLERAVVDFDEAMDFLATKRGVRRFALLGLCSGVDPVHTVAARDGRVVGAAFVDGYTYPTLRYRLIHAMRYGTREHLWRAAIRRLYPNAIGIGERDEVFVREYPAAAAVRRDYEAMLSRGTRLLNIFTGDFGQWFNHREQFFDMYGTRFAAGLEIEYRPKADHLLSTALQQQWFIARVLSFLQQL